MHFAVTPWSLAEAYVAPVLEGGGPTTAVVGVAVDPGLLRRRGSSSSDSACNEVSWENRGCTDSSSHNPCHMG